MSKNPRIHEAAKALGVTAKVLMKELGTKGFEYKTHMASLEDDAFEFLKKKHSDLLKLLDEKEKEAKSAPKKARAKPKKTGKVISQRSKTKTAEAKKSAETKTATPQVRILEDESGDRVEQKVIRGGIIRRRKVEAPPEPEPVPVVESTEGATELSSDEVLQAQEVQVEAQGETATSDAASEEQVAPEESEWVSTEVEDQVVAHETQGLEPETSVTEETESNFSTEVVIPTHSTPSSGRNLSAPKRLKIVGTSTPPQPGSNFVKPQSRPAASGAKPAATKATAGARPASPTETDEGKTAKDIKKKAGVSLKNWVAPKVNKRQLLGMTEEVEISRIGGSRRPKKQNQRSDGKTRITTRSEAKRKLKIADNISVADLADRMGLKAVEVVRKLVSMGQMVNVYQSVDFETASLVASEFGFETQNVEVTAERVLESQVEQENPDQLVTRPPVVTIMGHVDHGKTSLLDYIRKSKVVAKEAGGITQHIGAYQVEQNGKKITFLDTPGHEAFSKMRARGASVTDLVILVVAADEGTKPQTLEALAHARAAKVPIIVAVNKMDKPEANPDKVMQEMAGHELVPEAWGGDSIFVKCSAHSGEGIDELLEMILLQAEVLDLKANPDRLAKGIVIESQLDKGRGAVATVVVTSGTLKKGDPVVCGAAFGKVRALVDHNGQQIKEAGPATPVEIIGLNNVPPAGENFQVVSEEGIARKASGLLGHAKKQEDFKKQSRVSLEEMFNKMKSGEMSELRVVLKADVQGSVEAIADSLEKIKHDEVKVNVIFTSVGGISDSDVSLAAASGAVVIGFNVRPAGSAKQLASEENIQIKTYSVIYELIDDVRSAMEGLLTPDVKENILGQAEVREVYSLSKAGTIAGSYVTSGKIQRNAFARLIRDSVVIYDDKIQSVRRFKEDTREVAEGFECGIKLENYTDLKVGDVVECYEKVEMAKVIGS